MTEERFPATMRLGVAGLLAAFLIVGAFTRQPHAPLASLIGIAIALPGTYIAMRNEVRRPEPFLLAAGVGVILDAGGTHGSIGWFGLCVIALIACPAAGFRVGGAIAAAMVAVMIYKLTDDGFTSGWLPWVAGVFVSGLGGALIAHERCLMLALQEAQADLAERSRVEERSRIARDLHDVIAHSLTVSLLHVTAARLAVEHAPDDAARALAEAERLGRESLEEVRSIVGLMRAPGDAAPDLAPTPGLDGIGELVERFRSAGVEISLERGGAGSAIPGTVGTTAYRITQEALTNAAKHAPGAPVAVRIAADGEWLELTVDSAGGAGDGPVGSGSGLAGMRERAEAVGGRLAAAPFELDAGHGWRVSAELPIGGGWWRG